MTCRLLTISSAWISMSETWPPTWPYGWWIMILECGRENRRPLVPPASRTAAPEAARPMQ